MNTRNYHAFVLIGTLALLNANEPCCSDEPDCFSQLTPDREASGMRARLTDVKLLGTAKGGELFLLEIRNPNPRYVGIKTQPGEPADSVLARLGAAVLDTRAFNPHQAWTVHAEGNLLKSFPGSPGSFVFAGTETGLGIPPPPTSLTAAYDQDKQEVCLTWENPAEPYDGVGGSVGSQPGTATTVVQHWSVSERPAPRNESGRIEDRRNKGLCRFYIVGCRDGVISSPAVITWDYDDNSQSELDVPPFFGGVSANWKPWSYGGEPGMLVLEEGIKNARKPFDPEPTRVLLPEQKNFFQVIRVRSPGMAGGVYRKFLGLKPGHTYRITTRMNTMKMDPAKGDWSFSFHAVPHRKDVALTFGQLAGVAALPDGNTGRQAARIAEYGANRATLEKFEQIVTGQAKAGEQAVSDITLPPGTDTITVWFRHTGDNTSGVGFDWIKLKDVTPK